MKVLTVSLALLLAAVAPAAFAMDHAEGKMDCPMHDAAVTAEDRARHLDEMFASLDADKNGVIDRAEFDRHHEHMRHKHEADAPATSAPAVDEHAAHH